jgi:hypothetical protein
LRNFLPPRTVFPNNYDSDITLFKVYNTAETVTTTDTEAWAEEIDIEPVASDAAEIWADNGFANIDGELFYYDSVEKDLDSGKIIKLKNCSRNLGGTRTKNNKAGSEVRGYVIAQHHNQLASAAINLQKFIGADNSLDQNTLDWILRKIQATPIVADDFTTPNVTFEFKVLENDPFVGILGSYEVIIDGIYDTFDINFGDGTSSNDTGPGQHRYPPNIYPDPYVVVRNNKSEVIISPEVRPFPDNTNFATVPDEFVVPVQVDPFDIPLPEIPLIPTFVPPTIPTPSNIVNTPPIVFPCLNVNVPSFGGFSFPSISFPSISFPSVLSLTPSVFGISILNISVALSLDPPVPSVIEVVGGSIPSVISVFGGSIPSVISIINENALPSSIPISYVGTPLPSVSSFVNNPTIPSTISFINPPNFTVISVEGNFTVSLAVPESFPIVSFASFSIPPVSFVAPPTLSCIVVISCPAAAAPMANRRPQTPLFDFPEDEVQTLGLDNLDLGIPSEIFVRVPDISDIQIIHDIPAIIRVESPKIPNIKIDVPEFNIPKEIKVNFEGMPSSIELMATNLPKSISLDSSGLPNSIPLDVPKEFPRIKIDASDIPDKIQVVGIPSTIELIGAPSEIKLVLPEKPEIELVYRGAPIDVKVNLDIGRLTGDAENAQCVAIVPCVNK